MIYEYRRCDTSTIKGIKEAERLHQNDSWKLISQGFYSLMYERVITY